MHERIGAEHITTICPGFNVPAGLPAESITDIYTAAITKAGQDNRQSQLGNAFAAAALELKGASGAYGPKRVCHRKHLFVQMYS